MGDLSGRHVIGALKKASTWGTSVAPGANDGMLFLSEGLGVIAQESIINKSIGGRDSHVYDSDKLNFQVQDSVISQEMIFEMFELSLALAMGTAGSPSSGTDGYTHTLRPKIDNQDIFGTLAFEKKENTIIHTYPSVKFKGFEITGQAGENLKLNSTLIPCGFTNADGTVVAAAFDNVTHRAKSGIVNFNKCQFWMNAQSGGAVATGDAIYPSGLTFQYMRDMEPKFVSRNKTDATAFYSDQPEDGDFPEIMLTLDFPKYSVDTYVTALLADTHYKMKINFQGALIGTDYYNFALYLTNLELLNANAAIEGSGKIVQPLEFRCKAASAAPTGMSYADPFYIQVVNTVSSDYLA